MRSVLYAVALTLVATGDTSELGATSNIVVQSPRVTIGAVVFLIVGQSGGSTALKILGPLKHLGIK